MAMLRSPRRAVVPLFVALAVWVTSCSSGGSLYPVRGKVSVNGKAAAGANLIFHPEGGDMKSVPATATAGPDGTFTLVTGDKHGARAGKYVVSVTWPDPAKKPTEAQAMMGMAPDAPDLLKGRYSDPKQSKLRAEVKSGENDLEPFDLQ